MVWARPRCNPPEHCHRLPLAVLNFRNYDLVQLYLARYYRSAEYWIGYDVVGMKVEIGDVIFTE